LGITNRVDAVIKAQELAQKAITPEYVNPFPGDKTLFIPLWVDIILFMSYN